MNHRLGGLRAFGLSVGPLLSPSCDPFGTMPESNLINVEQSDLAVMYPELSLASLSAVSQEREELSRQLGQGAPEIV